MEIIFAGYLNNMRVFFRDLYSQGENTAGKELLQYSNYKLQEISEYLSFSNQSFLLNVSKKKQE